MGPLIAGWSWRFITWSRTRLGMAYRPLRETLREHAEQVLRDGLVG